MSHRPFTPHVLPTPAELRAAHRILRQALHTESPLIRRFVSEALHDSRPEDALAFCSKIEAALLATQVRERPTFSHVRPSPVGTPAPYVNDGRD